MKHFSHLSQVEIREIVTAVHNGEPKLQVAKRMGVDNSTVHYHVRKYEQSYIEQSSVYSLIKREIKKECIHPSMRCALCGINHDTLNRQEKGMIKQLRRELKAATEQLRHHGLLVE